MAQSYKQFLMESKLKERFMGARNDNALTKPAMTTIFAEESDESEPTELNCLKSSLELNTGQITNEVIL